MSLSLYNVLIIIHISDKIQSNGADLDTALDVKEPKHGLHVDDGLPYFAVHGAQEVQGNRQLEQQSVH